MKTAGTENQNSFYHNLEHYFISPEKVFKKFKLKRFISKLQANLSIMNIS